MSRLESASAEAILFELFGDDELLDLIFAGSGYSFDVADSYRLFAILQDACERVLSKDAPLAAGQRERMQECVCRLFITSLMPDDFGLTRFPEKGFVTSDKGYGMLLHMG